MERRNNVQVNIFTGIFAALAAHQRDHNPLNLQLARWAEFDNADSRL